MSKRLFASNGPKLPRYKARAAFIGVLVAGAFSCESEGKVPFGDDALWPQDSAGSAGTSGRGGSSGSSGRGGSSGSSGRGGSSGATNAGSGGSGSTRSAATVGESCIADSECGAIVDGYCADANICTAQCSSHVDCGCPPGTVNDDIADGACAAACLSYDDGSSYCFRVCESPTTGQCEGGSRCVTETYYGVCEPAP